MTVSAGAAAVSVRTSPRPSPAGDSPSLARTEILRRFPAAARADVTAVAALRALPLARLSFCCTPLYLQQVYQELWRESVSKMAVSSGAIRAMSSAAAMSPADPMAANVAGRAAALLPAPACSAAAASGAFSWATCGLRLLEADALPMAVRKLGHTHELSSKSRDALTSGIIPGCHLRSLRTLARSPVSYKPLHTRDGRRRRQRRRQPASAADDRDGGHVF